MSARDAAGSGPKLEPGVVNTSVGRHRSPFAAWGPRKPAAMRVGRRRNNSASLVTGSHGFGSHLLDQDVGRVTGLIGAEEAGHHPPRARHRATLRRLAPVAVVPAERHGACAQQRRSSSLWRLFASCGDFIEDSASSIAKSGTFLGSIDGSAKPLLPKNVSTKKKWTRMSVLTSRTLSMTSPAGRTRRTARCRTLKLYAV